VSNERAEMIVDQVMQLAAENERLRAEIAELTELALTNAVANLTSDQVGEIAERLAVNLHRIKSDELRAEVERLRAANTEMAAKLRAVTELHKPITIDVYAADCFDQNCDCEDDCPMVPTVVCGCCHEVAEEQEDEPRIYDSLIWPCLTVRLLAEFDAADVGGE
jgi:hypothetical protein